MSREAQNPDAQIGEDERMRRRTGIINHVLKVEAQLLEVLRLTTRYLTSHGSESARLDAELLLAQSMGLRRIDLYLQFDRRLDEAELSGIRRLMHRRATGEPIAYIMGVREFYGRLFVVSPTVLIPRPDTETLVDEVVAWARAHGRVNDPLLIGDVGTGSGCVGLSLAAELPHAHVVLSDIDPAALLVAEENARRLGLSDRVEFTRGDWVGPLRALGPFDVLVSNPPYLDATDLTHLDRGVRDFEPRLALDGGADGLAQYRRLAADLVGLLRPPALVAVEVDWRRAAEVAALLSEAMRGVVVDIDIAADLTGRPRVVKAQL